MGILSNIENLKKGSHQKVTVECDYCNKIFLKTYKYCFINMEYGIKSFIGGFTTSYNFLVTVIHNE